MGTKDQNLSTSRQWYHNHREEYNKQRRDQYAKDAALRKKAVFRARNYRKKQRQQNTMTLKPLYRYMAAGEPVAYGEGNRVKVYTTGYIAELIGCTPQIIRNWEAKGLIPEAIFSDRYRLYTHNQVKLIKMLAKVMQKYRGNTSKPRGKLIDAASHVALHWRD